MANSPVQLGCWFEVSFLSFPCNAVGPLTAQMQRQPWTIKRLEHFVQHIRAHPAQALPEQGSERFLQQLHS